MKKYLCFFIISLFFYSTLCAESSNSFSKPKLVTQESPGSCQKLFFCSDGKYLMSEESNYVKIWDYKTKLMIRNIPKDKNCPLHPGSGGICAFAPDGKSFIYPIEEEVIHKFKYQEKEIKTKEIKKIVKYDIPTGIRTTIELDKGTSCIEVMYSPDGNSIAISAHDIYIYDAKTLEKLFTLHDDNYAYFSGVSFSGKSDYISTSACSKDYKKKYNIVWDLKYKKILSSVKIPSLCVSIISPDGKYIAIKNGGEIFVRRSVDNKILTKLKGSEKYSIHDFNFSPDSTYLVTCTYKSGGGIKIWDFINKKEVQNYPEIDASCVVYTPDGKSLLLGERDKITSLDVKTGESRNIISVDSFTGKLNYSSILDSYVFSSPEISILNTNFELRSIKSNFPKYLDWEACDKGIYYSEYGKKEVNFFNFADNSILKSVIKLDDFATLSLVSANGKVLVTNHMNKYDFYDTSNGKLINSITLNDIALRNCISNNGHYAVFEINDNTLVFDIRSGKKIKLRGSRPAISNNERYLALYENSFVNVYNTSTWGIISKFEGCSSCFSGNNKFIATSDFDDIVRIYNVDSGAFLHEIESAKYSDTIFFDKDTTKIIVRNTNNICCYSVHTGKLLATFFANEDGWLSCTPEGFFTGDLTIADRFIHLVDGMEVYSLDKLAETFYRPDLVAAKLRGEDISKITGNVSFSQVLSTGEPPVIQLSQLPESSTARETTVNFTVHDMGGGIGDVFISHNGKVVQLAKGTRKLKLETSDTTQNKTSNSVPYSATISLFDGENTIEAYATNAACKIESRHAVTKTSWQGITSKPNLFVFGLGVNEYNSPGVTKLRFAVPDVLSIIKTFQEKSGGGMYGKVTTKLLLDDKVSKAQILKEISTMSSQVKPDDVFILYISGHGTAYNGDYYFISYDFDGYNLDTAVSKDFILECLSKISASKTLILLDTCNSGAIVGGGDTDTAFARLSHKTGQAIIAASSDTQYALEGYNDHGVFTFALLDALSGKADYIADNKITLNELNLYVSNFVPILTKLKWSHTQDTWCDIRKQDFPLVGK